MRKNDDSGDGTGGASVGVAIFARNHVGFDRVVREWSVHLVDSRLTAALIHSLGAGPMVIYSAYLYTGEGLSAQS